MFGRNPPTRADRVIGDLADRTKQLKRLRYARRLIARRLVSVQTSRKAYYDRRRRLNPIVVGDQVLIRSVIPANRDVVRKLFPRYVGPFTVCSRVGAIVSVRPIDLPNGKPVNVHLDRVIKCSDQAIGHGIVELMSPFRHSVDPNLEAEDPI